MPLNRTGATGLIVNSGSYTIPLTPYTHCQQFPIVLDVLLNNSAFPAWIVFNSGIPSIVVSPSTNELVGMYIVNISATVQFNGIPSVTYTSFWMEIKQNMPPLFYNDWASNYTMIAHKTWTRSFSFDYDPNSDQEFFST
jgi:hypothetical protein